MYLIVGLGNPEPEYENTRHNMGFNVINKIADACEIEVSQSKFKGLFGMGEIKGEKVILLKPQTFMNLSGESIIQIKTFYKIPPNKIIVIYDDMDLEVGVVKIRKKGGPGTHNGMKSVLGKLGTEKIKIRKKGGPGTHNGMKSVVERLKTEEFTRIRVGIGSPKENIDLISYVIGHVEDEEYNKLQLGAEKAEKAVTEILKNGVDIAMNKYN